MRDIVVYCQNTNSVGVRVVVDNLVRFFSEKYTVTLSDSLPKSKDVFVIPYGIKNTIVAIKNHYHVPVSLMVDYYSLSQWNSIKYFYRRKDFWTTTYSIKTILRCIKYYLQEVYVFHHCDSFMFVSQTDIDNIKKRYPSKKYFCVPNGVNIPVNYTKKKRDKGLCFGFLSIWVEESFFEHKWFLDQYWPQIISKHPEASLKVCGRYATPEMIQFFSSKTNVEFVGEVDSLSDFFDMIDVYLVPIPKGCGILNKVLDAFAHKTLVAGIPPSFSGFTYMSDSYVEFKSLQDFLLFINDYKRNRSQYDEYLENAYGNIQKFNDWSENYSKFIRELQQEKII